MVLNEEIGFYCVGQAGFKLLGLRGLSQLIFLLSVTVGWALAVAACCPA